MQTTSPTLHGIGEGRQLVPSSDSDTPLTAPRLIFIADGYSKTSFYSLRIAGLEMFVEVFYYYRIHRSDIIKEILISLGKISAPRQSPPDFKLPTGSCIQLVSILIM